MTTPIEPHIKNYIDTTVEKTATLVRSDFRRELGVATEEFQHRLKLAFELNEAKTRSLIREEMDIRIIPIEQKLDLVIKEVQDTNKRLDANLAAFQKQFGHHERRITRLEHRVA